MLRGGVDLATGVILKVTLYSFLYLYLEIQLPHIYIYIYIEFYICFLNLLTCLFMYTLFVWSLFYIYKSVILIMYF